MGKLRRNLENTNGLAQATYREVIEVKKYLENLERKLQSVCTQVAQATFQSCMQSADISEFFPVVDNEHLESFMDRNHPEWPSRRAAFYNLLYTIASNVKRGFARGMIKALFTRDYILSVKWPSFG